MQQCCSRRSCWERRHSGITLHVGKNRSRVLSSRALKFQHLPALDAGVLASKTSTPQQRMAAVAEGPSRTQRPRGARRFQRAPPGAKKGSFGDQGGWGAQQSVRSIEAHAEERKGYFVCVCAEVCKCYRGGPSGYVMCAEVCKSTKGTSWVHACNLFMHDLGTYIQYGILVDELAVTWYSSTAKCCHGM